MPSIDDVIRTITIRSTTEGMAESTDALKKLADAQGNVAVVSDATSKSALSVEQSYGRQTLRVDDAARMQNKVASETRLANAALAQGLVTQTEHAARLDLINQKYGQASPLAQAFGKSMQGVQMQMVALSAGAGPVGVFLAALGPLGIAAAAGIGATAAAFYYMSSEATRVAGVAVDLRNLSTVTSLSTGDIQSLEKATGELGLSHDQLASFIERFTTQLHDAHNATGTYYDKIREVNPALAQQVLTTKGVADQINILATAYRLAGVEGNNLLKAAGGRGGMVMAPLLGTVSQAGGVQNLPENTFGLSRDEIDSYAKSLGDINTRGAEAKNALANMWTADLLAMQQREVDLLESAVDHIRKLKEESGGGWWAAIIQGASTFTDISGPTASRPSVPKTPEIDPFGTFSVGGSYAQLQTVQSVANIGKATIAALGAAASESEKYNQRIKELNVSLKEGILTQGDYNRAVGAAGLQTAIAIEGARISMLGQAAPLTELLKQKQDEINMARMKGATITANENAIILASVASQRQAADTAILMNNNVVTALTLRNTKTAELNVLIGQHKLTQDQATTSLQAYELVIEKTINQQEIQKAQLPQLKTLEIDSGSLRNQLDITTTGSLNNMTTALADITMGTKAAGAAFQNLGLQVVRSLEEMIIKMTIITPIAKSLQATLGGTSGGFNLLSLFGLSSGPSSAASVSGSASGFVSVSSLSTGGMVGIDGMRTWIHPAYFENAPRFDIGGMITDGGVPIIAHPGERVLNRQETTNYNRGGGGAPTTINMGDIHIDGIGGADPATVARLQVTLAEFRRNQYADTVQIIKDASNRGLRLHA